MKNLNTIINAVLGIAVIVLFVLYFNLKQGVVSNTEKIETPIEDSTLAEGNVATVDSILSQSKALNFPIAYVNVDTIAENFKYFVNKKKALEQSIENKYKDLQRREASLNKEAETIARKIQDGTTNLVTAQDVQNKELEFQKRMQDLMQEKQVFEQKVMKDEEQLVTDINKSIDKFLIKYKDKLNYSYVFQKGGMAGALLYANDSLDITNDVLKALNAEYAAKVKK